MTQKKANSLRHLDAAIRRAAQGQQDEYLRIRTLMANAVVSQMLPNGVLKGGSALKLRYGDKSTRFTTDLDAASESAPDAYASELEATLQAGWEGFTGRIVSREPASPEGIPTSYVMRPFDIRLSYLDKPWCTVPLELGHNEIGDANEADLIEQTDAKRLFELLGFPAPKRVRVMRLEHQVAQKLHAVTGPGDRVRDLIDLQIIEGNSPIDLRKTRVTCERLFKYRNAQPWPPAVVTRDGWDDQYHAQAEGLPVLKTVDEAVAWTNRLIKRISRADLKGEVG